MPVAVQERVYWHIRNELIRGRYAQGDRVSELALAREMGVSRIPVREAISRLTAEGLLQKIPNAGSFVPHLSREEVRELFELRAAIESQAAARAAERIDAEQLNALWDRCRVFRDLAQQVRETGATRLNEEETQRFIMADVEFHLIILQAAGYTLAPRIVANLRLMERTFYLNVLLFEEDLLRGLAINYLTHWRLYRVVARRDPEGARRTMWEHVSGGLHEVLGRIERARLERKGEQLLWSPRLARAIASREGRPVQSQRLDATKYRPRAEKDSGGAVFGKIESRGEPTGGRKS